MIDMDSADIDASPRHVTREPSALRGCLLHVILDAMNISRGYKEYALNAPEGSEARIQLDIEGLWISCEYFERSGIPFKAFAARGFIEAHGEPFRDLQRRQLLFATPGGVDDDFMLAHANRWGSWVISNDRFLDHVREKGYRSDWIDYHRSGFMWDPNFELEPNAQQRMLQYHRTGIFSPSMQPGLALRKDFDAYLGGVPIAAGNCSTDWPGVHPHKPASETRDAPRADIMMPRDLLQQTIEEGKSSMACTSMREQNPLSFSSRAQDDSNRNLGLVIEVPAGAVGRIIGKAGANIRALQEDTACAVDVGKAVTEEGTKRVTIRGSEIGRNKAAEIVLEKVSLFMRFGNGIVPNLMPTIQEVSSSELAELAPIASVSSAVSIEVDLEHSSTSPADQHPQSQQDTLYDQQDDEEMDLG